MILDRLSESLGSCIHRGLPSPIRWLRYFGKH